MKKHRFNWRPSPTDHPIVSRCSAVPAIHETLSFVDFRKYSLPVRDQGNLGACSGFATAACREIMSITKAQALDGVAPLSPAYLYAHSRMIEGTFPRDAGATLADEMSVLETRGVCPELLLPYNATATEAPDEADDEAALPFQITMPPTCLGFANMVTAAAVELMLCAARPVVFALPVYESFEDIGADGIMPIPKRGEKLLGGHALLAVGYDRDAQHVIVRNSWGQSWGAAGHCYMPYSIVPTWFEAWAPELLPVP